jgi:hypothetical protein
MNYGELKTQFLGLLKRRDLTDAQADIFLQQAVSRIQRVLRIPPMEKSIAVTYDGDVFHDGKIPIPSDYLRLIAITATPPGLGENEVKQKDLETVLRDRWGGATGRPRSFVRRGGLWTFGPIPPVGTVFRIDYYDEFPALSKGTDTGYLTMGANDLVIYGALSFAGDWFIDKRAPLWEQRFEAIVAEIQNQADQDALVNAVASAAYEFPED